MYRITEDQAHLYEQSYDSEWFQLKDDGDSEKVQFLADNYNDILIYAVHEVELPGEQYSRYVGCLRRPGEDETACPFCNEGVASKVARYIVMYQHSDESIRVWERGRRFMTQLQAIYERYAPLSDQVFEIVRSGKTGDLQTTYQIFPMGDRAEAVDLSDVEMPDMLGFVLNKTAEDMMYYLDNGDFPEDAASNEGVTRRGGSRGGNSRAGNSRAGNSRAGGSRAGSRAGTRGTGASQSRASRRGSRADNRETF